ncbi:MAG: TlpA family protein disulfide reductase, partial [Lutibacter sp.]|nr:TlpA family protein disulfide reductase [Lutibacter sp.]
QFLLKKPFNYKVASVPQEFMENELEINAYPTHFIIDKIGKIKKVVNSANELILELDASGILNIDESQMRPPPPAF